LAIRRNLILAFVRSLLIMPLTFHTLPTPFILPGANKQQQGKTGADTAKHHTRDKRYHAATFLLITLIIRSLISS
jgi:hypothetical protein